MTLRRDCVILWRSGSPCRRCSIRATKTGAEIMGRGAEFGTLENGKLADVLVVDGDVLEDIALLEDREKFIAVMQGGIIKAGQLAKQFPTVVKREK